MEIWKDIPDYEGIYEVSNEGKVRTKEGKTTQSILHGERTWKSIVLKEKNPNGRDVRVSLYRDKVEKQWLVHRLVAKAFIPNPENKPCVNHKDGNPRNNNVNNLEWSTHEENQNHAFDNDLVNTNTRMFLRNKDTGDLKEFRSMAKASEFLGWNTGYVSGKLAAGKPEVNSKQGGVYEVYVPAKLLFE